MKDKVTHLFSLHETKTVGGYELHVSGIDLNTYEKILSCSTKLEMILLLI